MENKRDFKNTEKKILKCIFIIKFHGFKDHPSLARHENVIYV